VGERRVHTGDIVDALVATLPRGLGQGVIQIGPDSCSSIRQVAETIVAVSGKDIEISYDTSKPEGDRGRCADYGKARRILGWEPRVDLHTGLQETYQWIARQIRLRAADPN
jgi:GDP-D-mannose 3',5'-epimerase